MRRTLSNLSQHLSRSFTSARRKRINQEYLYLNDIPVSNRKEDKFQFAQMADLIYELLEQGQLPLHIGLMGSWGTGKTSVLKLLETRVNAGRKKDHKYLLKFINVWKFADDAPSLHRKIVREVESELQVEDSEGIKYETTTLDSKKTAGLMSLLNQRALKKYGFIVALYAISLIIITLVYEWLFKFKDPWALTFMNSTTLLVIMVAQALLNKSGLEITSQESKRGLALQHGDQFEERFENAVRKYLKANKGKKLILVFDDLDRLPPKQLVAALNTIKTFLRSNQCAFIVPCDEEILLEGISSAFSEKKMSNFSVSEYLTKTFDLQLHLPAVEKVNMRTFAKNLLAEQKVKWSVHQNISIERILGILIHSGVRTPRQVKKILNAYAFDWYLALKRDSEAGVEILSKQPNHIAIFTVLKTDFPSYFHIVRQNPTIIQKPIEEQIDSINKESIQDEDPDESLQYLEAFLSRIKGELPKDPRPFVYFSNQLLNPLTGKPELENTKEKLLNGQNDKFLESFSVLSSEDKQLVIASALEEIDSANNVFTDNVLKILIVNNETLKYTAEIDTNRWERIITENLNTIAEFEILEVCKAIENIGCSNIVWETYGASISGKENYNELFTLWVNHPKFLENLNINDIGNKVISAFREEGKSHIAANSLATIDPKNSILRNDKFNWKDVLVYSMLSEDLPDTRLAEWLKTWSQKTEEEISSSLINELLNEFMFKDAMFLEGIGELWCNSFENSNSKQEEMNFFLELMNTVTFSGFTEEDFRKIATFFEELDYMTISNRVTKIFKTWWEEDESKTYDLLNCWKSTPGVAGFSSSIFSFDLEDDVLALVTDILTDRAERVPKENDIIDSIKNELIDAKNNNRRTVEATTVVEKLLNNSIWAEKFEPFIDEFFPMSNNIIWLSWPQQIVENHIELLNAFMDVKKELAEWIIDSIFDLHKVKQRTLTTSLGYSNNHTVYINLIIDKLMDNDNIDWDNFIGRTIETKLMEAIDEPIIDRLLIALNKKSKMDNGNYNKTLISYHTPTSDYHQEIAVQRWNFLNPTERKEYLEKYGSSEDLKNEKTSFGEKLVNSFELKPDIRYISEIGQWNFDQETSNNMIDVIIQATDIQRLNIWFLDSIKKIIKGVDYWTMIALHKTVRLKKGISIPNKDTLEELLLLNDERSLLTLEIVKDEKNVAASLRNSIMSLKDYYPDQVEEIRKSFKWRWRKN
ncbi:P-loop NTPase fold protein [Paenibacillus polymyxa]|uniref:KAP family P-loop NTPase fold protein n=1 Tax=Paenibacillus polymyxa TaxID=1406 RepID=UPI002ED16C76|nr:P-loop NTPase fold protein [Paenibacillus polymyxa]